MVHDDDRGRVVLFGASFVTSTDGGAVLVAQTWEWDGTAWQQQWPASSPAPRAGFSMAYDGARKRVVVFGGVASAQGSCCCETLNDLWAWDGTTWVNETPTSSPSPRTDAALEYDAARHALVLFGGEDRCHGSLSRVSLSDTWEWDGAHWLERQSSGPLGGRRSSATAFDADLQRVVLCGGQLDDVTGVRTDQQTFDDVWTWDGTAWSDRCTSPL